MLFFSANDGISRRELWMSDGTAAGTVMVKDINPGSDAFPLLPELTNVNGTLFFRADDGTNGSELWALQVGPPSPIPTVSERGLAVMTLLLLATGTIVLGRRGATVASWELERAPARFGQARGDKDRY